MKRPDFFIVGAPKCGTTALYHYLSEHPHVFLPEFKEPHFFAEDLNTPDHVCSEQAYLELFRPAGDEHRAVGEGSVWYLFSSTAARRIREFAPEAKVIVMFRSPVEMFVSLHNQAVASLYEQERDPERAWALQEARRRGEHLGELCEEPRVLQYGEVCRLGAQFERLLAVFPRARVHPILLDDLRSSPRTAYRKVLDFLQLPDDHRRAFPRINEAYQPRWRWLLKLHQRGDRKLLLSPAWRRLLPWLAPLRPLSRALRRHNVKTVKRTELRPPFRTKLTEFFAADIDQLARLLDRDLSAWKKPQ